MPTLSESSEEEEELLEVEGDHLKNSIVSQIRAAVKVMVQPLLDKVMVLQAGESPICLV